MNKIKKVEISKFWGDKTVEINFDKDVNFFIGPNGSGKTTIINLIAATLTADFKTLDSTFFETLEITLMPKEKHEAIIKVEKKERDFSPYPKIEFSLKNYGEKKFTKFNLDEIEEDNFFRHYKYDVFKTEKILSKQTSYDISAELGKLVNVSWLTIHRLPTKKLRGDKNFESSIDQKIEDLQSDLIKYFSQLNRLYSNETENFQKYIFESLIDSSQYENVTYKIDSEKEKESLKSIYAYFKINEKNYSKKLDNYFEQYEKSHKKLVSKSEEPIELKDFAYLLNTLKIHAAVEEWNKINDKQKQINNTKDIFIKVLNSLLIRKIVFINERNELMIETQSGKIFPLTKLSSGEKQLIIIFGQALLQGENPHIYIADEPELSLHIEWQEKLVKNLKSINPNSQIIFATHSPDIVSDYSNKVFNIEKSFTDGGI